MGLQVIYNQTGGYTIPYTEVNNVQPMGYNPVNLSAFWDNLTLMKASNPKISKYIQWLDNATVPNGDPLYNLTYGMFKITTTLSPLQGYMPSNSSLVRFGIINLPYGGQIVILAYVHNYSMVIVLDSRITNQTAWLEALSRVATDIQASNGDLSPIIGGFPASVYTYLNQSSSTPLKTIYVLWRRDLNEYGYYGSLEHGYVLYDGHILPLHVYVFLEEPIYLIGNNTGVNNISISSFWSAEDLAFWDIIGAPTLALGVNL